MLRRRGFAVVVCAAIVLSLATVVLSVAMIAGCSLPGPTSGTDASTSKLAQAERSHEYPSPRPSAQRALGDHAGPVKAIRVFATRYINWSAGTVSAQMRSLASRSVGQARSAMQLAAAQTEGDYELQRGGIANSGTVEAVSPLIGRRDLYVVVTRELTTATNTAAYQGLRPAWHVALAAVEQTGPDGWVVSRWQPEN